jgi:hypothetical protein
VSGLGEGNIKRRVVLLSISGSVFYDDGLGGACTDARHAQNTVLFACGERLVLVVVIGRWLDVETIHRADIRADAVSVTNAVVYDDFNHF